LRLDGRNLSAYLYKLKIKHSEYYNRIIDTIQLAAPFFGDFEIAPSELDTNSIILNWKEKNTDYLLGPHQLSDGMLRFIALVTLLMQPEKDLPDLLIIDEPELGLHPFAINLLGSLVRKVSSFSQVILATQSIEFVNQFEPNEIIVVNRIKSKQGRDEYETQFQPVDAGSLKDWLKEYTIGELWEKNVIGGRPSS
jgi:predicted ATPase